MGLRAKNQLIFVNTIDFRPLVPQKLSVETSNNDNIQQKSTFRPPVFPSTSMIFGLCNFGLGTGAKTRFCQTCTILKMYKYIVLHTYL